MNKMIGQFCNLETNTLKLYFHNCQKGLRLYKYTKQKMVKILFPFQLEKNVHLSAYFHTQVIDPSFKRMNKCPSPISSMRAGWEKVNRKTLLISDICNLNILNICIQSLGSLEALSEAISLDVPIREENFFYL